jgi:hypothetical protein
MAQIQKGTTYSTGDQVTATNLNALADAAILLPGAITDQTAKTVPLAADTVLIHSAADTALRKSTLTQLFSNATGIPLTTGVTGILPAANGGTGVANASTLTIAGNVTHAGAFTQTFTATANTSLTLPVTGTLATLAGSEALSNKTITASPISGSTGAFTTLSASGLSTLSSGIAVRGNTAPASGAGLELVWDGTQSVIQSYNRTSPAYQPLWLEGGTLVRVGLGGAQVAGFSSTGLAVTGALSASGAMTTTSQNGFILDYNTGNRIKSLTASQSSPKDYLTILSAGATGGWQGATRFGVSYNGGTVLYPLELIANTDGTTAGVAVTGALSSTTGANFATSSGSVGIGTASPAAPLHIAFGSAVNDAELRIQQTTNGTASQITIAANNDGGAIYNFIRSVTTSGTEHWRIGGGAAASTMAFSTGGSERARITSDGNLLVGMTGTPSGTPSDPVGVCIFGASATGATVFTRDSLNHVIYVNNKTSSGGLVNFFNGGNTVGSITSNGTITIYNTTSDYRLKDITGPLTDSGAFIDALKPKVGTWKSNGSKFAGFLAHEFAEVCPSAVTGEKDAVDAEGNPKYQGMQASSAEVIANLVAELQSVRQRLAALEA